MTEQEAYVFEAAMEDVRGVSRTIAVAGDQTLEDLHDVVRRELGWEDDHLYSFWLDGRYWGDRSTEFTRPIEIEENTGERSAEARIADLDLEAGQSIAYVFDFGDEWRVRLRVAEIRPAGDETYPQVLARRGEAPPQYGADAI